MEHLARLVESAAATTSLEWLGVVLALGYLLLAVRQNPGCWFFSIASSAVYCVLFARASLPMQSLLQLFYVAMAVYGWSSWRGSEATGGPLPVRRWPLRRHLLLILALLAIALANGSWLAARGAGAAPYVDAAVTWGSVATTWLVARKLLENWLYWIVLDLVAAWLYWSQGLIATALLFVLYSAIAVHGYLLWRRDAPAPMSVDEPHASH